MTKPFRFNAIMETDTPGMVYDTVSDPDREIETQGQQILGYARKVEALGLDGCYVGDHLYAVPDALIQCMAVAGATTSLRVGQSVLINDFRHPVQVAKAIASIDVFSDGRAEVGLGAGYNYEEYRQSGVQFDPPKVRIARLREAVAIITALLRSEEPVTFKGEHYTVDELLGMPRPVQRPGPPLMIGAGGPTMLRLAGEMADIVNIVPKDLYPSALPRDPRQFTAESFAGKIDVIKEGAGARFEDLITGVVMIKVVVTDDREAGAREAHAELDGAYRMLHGHPDGFPLSLDEILESPYFFIGNHDEIAQHLVALRSTFGSSHLMIMPGVLDDMSPVVDRLKGK